MKQEAVFEGLWVLKNSQNLSHVSEGVSDMVVGLGCGKMTRGRLLEYFKVKVNFDIDERHLVGP